MKNLLFLLFYFISFNPYAQYFDTGLEYKHKIRVGKGVTLGGLALMNYTEGPTEAIGAIWTVGGAMNLYLQNKKPIIINMNLLKYNGVKK